MRGGKQSSDEMRENVSTNGIFSGTAGSTIMDLKGRVSQREGKVQSERGRAEPPLSTSEGGTVGSVAALDHVGA